MDFKEATDALCESLGHEDVAKALRVSIQTVRQARLSPGAKGFRGPPDRWETALLRLAEIRAAQYKQVAGSLRQAAKAKRVA
jgi:hypothetical protein